MIARYVKAGALTSLWRRDRATIGAVHGRGLFIAQQTLPMESEYPSCRRGACSILY